MGFDRDKTLPDIASPLEDPPGAAREPSLCEAAADEEATPSPGAGPRRNGFRDEKTTPAEPRTTKWGAPPAWMVSPEPPPPVARSARDPLFWPVVVFVGVFVACIGIVLVSQPGRRAPAASAAQLVTTP